MKYSILGFNQEVVVSMSVTKEVRGKVVEYKLDISDLLILQCIADFMNRPKIQKTIIDDKIYCWVKLSTILEDLPILNIKQQAFSDKLDKLVLFGMLEKQTVRNQTGSYSYFRIGENYEKIKYSNSKRIDTDLRTSSELHLRTSSELQDKDNNDYNNSLTNEKEDTNVSKKDELFEECWKLYGRKGSKSKSKSYWNKLKDSEKTLIKSHIEAYVLSVSEKKYQKDFERYLRDKIFNNVVYKGNITIFDPERESSNDNDYRPQVDGFNLIWSDQHQCYISMYDIDMLVDGYTADNRPSSAMVMVSGIKYQWNTQSKKWEVQ